jgi:hypothetical protein
MWVLSAKCLGRCQQVRYFYFWGNCHNLNFQNGVIYLCPPHQIHRLKPQRPYSHFSCTSISIIQHQFQNLVKTYTSISYPVVNEMDHVTVNLFPATFSTVQQSTTVPIPYPPLLLNPHLKSENGSSSQYQFIFNRILHFVSLLSHDRALNRLQNGIWVHMLSHNTTNTFVHQGWVVCWTKPTNIKNLHEFLR